MVTLALIQGVVNTSARALEILQQKREVLTKGARLMPEKEKIEGTELQALIGETSSQPLESHKKGN